MDSDVPGDEQELSFKRNETGPFAPRIKQYVDRLLQARMDIFDDGNRKRGHPVEPTDGLDNAKRIRLGAEVPARFNAPPLPPGPISVAQLFTLSTDEGLTSFDVTQLPIELVVKITLPVLQQINQASLDEAVNNVRSRYITLSRAQSAAQNQPLSSENQEDDEEDYEPDFQPTEDPEQILNKADDLVPEDPLQTTAEVALGPFKLPQPVPLTPEENYQLGKSTLSRVFSMMSVLDDQSAKRPKRGLNRLAGSNYDREAWITVITRLATRASADLEGESGIDDNENSKVVINGQSTNVSLSDGIRENLWKYIIEDFRARIHIAISWLNEEWFNDQIQLQNRSRSPDSKTPLPQPQKHYEKWVLKVLDVIIPYLDAKDKLLIRFLSEIPAIDERILERVKGLARDPERVVLAVNSI